jgi:hypothetical protein
MANSLDSEAFEFKLESSDILEEWIDKSHRKNNFIEEWERKIEKEAIAMH